MDILLAAAACRTCCCQGGKPWPAEPPLPVVVRLLAALSLVAVLLALLGLAGSP
jgi:hypothetical protein